MTEPGGGTSLRPNDGHVMTPDAGMASLDTIAAVATGAGRAGIGVVRVSGPRVPAISRALTGQVLTPRVANYLPFLDADSEPIDIGIALRFEAPWSFTGEHVLELHGHGGPVVLDLILARVLATGARLAGPGEFSERAFLNDKLDLAQAEAIADLIDSGSTAAARAAVRSMGGALSDGIAQLRDELVSLRAWLEAALDFSEDDIDFLADPRLGDRAEALIAGFDSLLRRSAQGQRLRDGLTLVIAGRANVGKSSLLNALAGTDTAIVTPVAGTTRDLLREHITLDGIPFHLIDTAGLRPTEDLVEREGMVRTRRAVGEADHLLLLVDADAPELPELELPATLPRTIVFNKIDLLGNDQRSPADPAVLDALLDALPGESDSKQTGSVGRHSPIMLSLLSGEGLPALRAHLLSLAGNDTAVETPFIARRRHLDALERARMATIDALARLQQGTMPELAAEELREAQRALDTVTGRLDSEQLLGRIFADFCIGK